jgi:hypothetical protein
LLPSGFVNEAPREPKRVAIVQSSYVPWKGYLDLIRRVDEFILLDDAQFTKRDWRSRNRVKTAQGPIWLTVPVQVRGRYHQRIDETLVADPDWARRHWSTIEQAYRRSPGFDEVRDALRAAYARAGDEERLSAVNRTLLDTLCGLLRIDTPLTWSTDYGSEGARTDRLVHLCRCSGATTYLSGPAAQAYLDEEAFHAVGVEVEWMRYEGYPEYPQPHGPFEHAVSVIDLLASVGPARAPEYLEQSEVRA